MRSRIIFVLIPVIILLFLAGSLTHVDASISHTPTPLPIQPDIYGGEKAAPAEFPWMVAIIDESESIGLLPAHCGGALIKPNWVLTAAHCFYPLDPNYKDRFKMVVGITTLPVLINENHLYQELKAEKFIIHPQFQFDKLLNDVALIKLASSAKIGGAGEGRVEVINLASADDLNYLDSWGTVIGWGLTRKKGYILPQLPAKTLRKLSEKVQTCGDWGNVDDYKLCANPEDIGDAGVCPGDSGGPFFVFVDGYAKQIGIVSSGNQDDKGNCIGTTSRMPDIYTRVSYYRNWIDEQIALNSPLSTPQLGSPSNGELVSLRPMFTWSPVPTRDRYVIQISLDSNFDSREIIYVTPSLFFIPDSDLQPGKTYYWRVWAIRGEDSSPFSEVRSFTTTSTAAPSPTPVPPTPTPNPQDRTPPSASGYNVSINNAVAHLAPSGVQDNPGGSGVREVSFSAKFDGQWRGIGVASSPPYALDWNMCAMNVPNGDIEFGMEVWDNAGNKWVWSEHYPNPHAIKNYDCSQTSLQDGVYLYYETGQQQDVCRIVQDTASIGDFCGARFNDHVRSIKVVGSFYFALYKDDNFSGAPLQGNFTGDLPADWQDVVSSIRVRRTDPAVVTLYSLGDYNGETWKTDRTIYDLGHWNWNDKAQSVEVEPGYGALICADNDFHGICGRVGASDSQRRWSDINALANGLRSSVSSIQICDGDCPPAPSAPSLILPPENALLSPNNPVIMQWNGSALQYQVEYWGGSLGRRVTTGWQSGNSLRLETLPESREPYYWHVRGWNEYGEGGWSPVQRFYLYENRSPSSPTQLNPEHNSIHTQIPELCWQTVQDPDGETVTYWVDLMGAEYAQSGWISDTCWQPNVSKTGVYAWHVQSRDSAGAKSAYSSDWTFIVQEPATATPTPSPTPTPTPVPVWRFSGYTYRGQPDQATALGGVTLYLYGRNDGDPEPGDWEKSVTTNAGGYFNFHIIEPWNFDHFTLVAEPPEGLAAVSAWSANGNVIAPDTITWDYPQPGSHENKFYFDVPTPTLTPTSTPTVTPTPTPSRQWLPVIIAP